jgi:hypothetical protein
VLLNGVATRIDPGRGAVLVPSVSSTAWDAGISTRVVLFRDFGAVKVTPASDDEPKAVGWRGASVIKANGRLLGPEGNAVGFGITGVSPHVPA